MLFRAAVILVILALGPSSCARWSASTDVATPCQGLNTITPSGDEVDCVDSEGKGVVASNCCCPYFAGYVDEVI